ncbi:hypothetical protein EYF80_029368 [Liparis tanakae]|uniref:Uncharacterized protein n=1 Tax=Liparis tanakae TaxID=230148 RepID=A0A4Z2H3Q8_9TELE|nr:hypothetical protein EYF80_029368 [Liparis tanakae]
MRCRPPGRRQLPAGGADAPGCRVAPKEHGDVSRVKPSGPTRSAACCHRPRDQRSGLAVFEMRYDILVNQQLVSLEQSAR